MPLSKPYLNTSLNLSNGLWVMRMCQGRFILGKNSTILASNGDNGRG